MGPEANIGSIMALEKQIEEGLGDIIQLKRVRNSLLNISTRVPPEILGQVFHWNVIPEGVFDGLQKGSYNFLLVCHHWFEVASGTPELWAFWGNSLAQWSQRYRCSGTAPLDLVLRAGGCVTNRNNTPFDGPVRDALRDRAACDSIRSVHLAVGDKNLLRSTISSLTPDGEGIRCSSIKSLRVENANLDVSKFLARHRFPKLRLLHLFTSVISPCDLLKTQATSLTTLKLGFFADQNSPTISEMLLILASYPELRNLTLYNTTIPHDVDDGSTFRVPLHRLKKLELSGDCYHVFRLLHQLEYPDTMDRVHLFLLDCTEEGVPEFIKPYLQDRIRCDDRFRGRLGIDVSCATRSFSFEVKLLDKFNTPNTLPGHGYPSVSLEVGFGVRLSQGAEERYCIDLIALTPRECVVGFTGGLRTDVMRTLLATMPNIEDLALEELVISDVFLRPDPVSRTKILPSLRRLRLTNFTLQDDDDWSPLITYLEHQTSGGQAISLSLYGDHPPIPPEVAWEMKGLAE